MSTKCTVLYGRFGHVFREMGDGCYYWTAPKSPLLASTALRVLLAFTYSGPFVRDATPEEIAAKAEADRIAKEWREEQERRMAERNKPCEHIIAAFSWLKANGLSIDPGCGCCDPGMECSQCGRHYSFDEALRNG